MTNLVSFLLALDAPRRDVSRVMQKHWPTLNPYKIDKRRERKMKKRIQMTGGVVENAPVFKVGDRVRVTRGVYTQCVCEVTEVRDDGNLVLAGALVIGSSGVEPTGDTK